ncbi:MAG: extracellular solute-binding protein [Clostridia bacterium]|nr:extracellular solute-binding protein [Clostridia bacterium]
MRRNHTKRLMAFVLSLLMLSGCIVPTFAADDSSDGKGSVATTTLKEISATLNAISYDTYRTRYPDAKKATETVEIDIADYIADATTAEVELLSNVADDYGTTMPKAVYIGDEGKVTWPVTIPETALYAVEITYTSESDKTNSIERVFYIDDVVPFGEARYLRLTKTWEHQYDESTGRFTFDAIGNELRPSTNVYKRWTTQKFVDSNTYYATPFEFYFEKGETTIALEGVREDVVIGSIRLVPYDELPTYEEMLAAYAQKGYTEGTDQIYLAAEMPSAVSDYTIYPVYDRTSAISEPQHATLLYRNTIGAEKWASMGQWIEYEFEITNAGLYTIDLRFKQSDLAGLYTSRKLTIDGETPFAECNYLRFSYDTDWQVASLTDGIHDTLQFYFEPGKHTIRLEVTLGEMGDIVRRVSESLDSINKSYLEILKLTGSNPDQYRDYGFARVMPDTIENMILESINLNEIIDYLESMNGVKSQHSATLEQIAILLEKMGTDEDEIAKNLTNLKNHIGTMGTWVSNVTTQPLEIDYILVQGESVALPKANAGFFQSIWYELKMFFGSFYADYNSLGGNGEDGEQAINASVTAWVATGRDQAQIMRSLVDDKFTPNTGIAVELKLVAGGTLLPSILAGVGPDVALDGSGADPIQYAIRGAALDLDQFNTTGDPEGRFAYSSFEQVASRFTEAALIPLSLYGKTYGLPETQNFCMMFYRKDILADLGLEVPKTWDELMAMIPILQFNNMEIGLPNNYQIFMYQMGGELWADDGMRINLDSNIALEAFEDMCNMFTQYSLPYSYSFPNRFKTGEMPIGIIDYTTYNQMILFATEIAGLWEMVPIPGMVDEDGNINNVAVSTVTSIVLPAGTRDKHAAWALMDWWVDTEFQVDYSNELVAVLGPAAKNATANREALEELPWSSSEFYNIDLQMNNLTAITAYPGSYIIARYTNFAFLDAYNDLADPVDSLLNYINAINKEVTRKRAEFDYETLEVGQTLAEKRSNQALELMETLDGYADAKAAARAAIEAEDAAALYAAAAAFGSADETAATIAGYLKDAANAYETYALYE